MLCYVCGIQRDPCEIGFHFNLFDDPNLSNPRSGVVSALKNKLPEQQSNGAVTKGESTLTPKYIEAIFSSKNCPKGNPEGCRSRLMFMVGCRIGSRTT